MNRCADCGKFRPWNDLAFQFVPDSAFSSEDSWYECAEGKGCHR